MSGTGSRTQTQGMIEMACMAGNAYAIARAEALQGAVLERFEEEGVNSHLSTTRSLQAFHEATETVMERKRSAKDEMFGRSTPR
jgi:TRAP-type mannitol/chloroaromatic compound transport system substrate-binding protein